MAFITVNSIPPNPEPDLANTKVSIREIIKLYNLTYESSNFFFTILFVNWTIIVTAATNPTNVAKVSAVKKSLYTFFPPFLSKTAYINNM